MDVDELTRDRTGAGPLGLEETATDAFMEVEDEVDTDELMVITSKMQSEEAQLQQERAVEDAASAASEVVAQSVRDGIV